MKGAVVTDLGPATAYLNPDTLNPATPPGIGNAHFAVVSSYERILESDFC